MEDNSGNICEEYALKDSRIKVIHKQNGGLGFARNSGLDIATGEYVTFLDSDDLFALKMIPAMGPPEDKRYLRFECLKLWKTIVNKRLIK